MSKYESFEKLNHCGFQNFQILFERTQRDTDILNTRLTKLQQDYDQQLVNCDSLAQENQQKFNDLKVCVNVNQP